MRILFVLIPAYNPEKGGVQRIVEKLGSYFHKAGNEVSCFSFEPDDPVRTEFGELVCGEKIGGAKVIQNINKFIAYVENWNPDIVLNEMPYENEIGQSLNKCKNRQRFKSIACLNNSLFSVKNNLDLYATTLFPESFGKLFQNRLGYTFLFVIHWIKHRSQLKRIINMHDAFVLPTGSLKNIEELKYFIGDYELHKVHCIPNSIPDFDFDHLFQKENRILHVGRLNEGQKRSDLLLKVWKKIADRLPDWEFDIVGDGPYMETLKKTIELENIPRVNLLGFQQPDMYYKRAKLFLMTSAFEGFPSVLLEAQSNGVIPIAFKSYPAIEWIVNHGKDSMLVEAFNSDKMAQGIIYVCQEDNRINELRELGLLNAKKYTLNNVGAMWFVLFKNLENA